MQFHRALFREPSNYLQGRGQTLSRPMKLYGLPWRVATFLQPSSPHLWTSLLPNMQKEQKHHIQKKQLFFLTVPCASTLVRCSAGVSAESSLPPLVLGLKPTDTLPFSISVGCVIFDSLLFAAGVVFLHAAWSLHNFLSWPASNWAWPKQPSSNQRCAKSNQIMAATFLWCLQCHCSSFPSKTLAVSLTVFPTMPRFIWKQVSSNPAASCPQFDLEDIIDKGTGKVQERSLRIKAQYGPLWINLDLPGTRRNPRRWGLVHKNTFAAMGWHTHVWRMYTQSLRVNVSHSMAWVVGQTVRCRSLQVVHL